MRATVALPTWKNESVLWLSLEGLCHQKTQYDWELVVMECESNNKDLIASYKDRLTKAGCKNITYIHSPYRMPLPIKWKQIAENSKGEIFLLQASDDYHSSDRIERTVKAFEDGCEWYQTRYHYHYSFIFQKVIKFDMLTVDGWVATGFNMAMHTEKVRNIPETQQTSGIDFYLFNSIQPKKVFTDEVNPKGGCATDGLNTISKKRFNQYINAKPPFHQTEKTIDTIGLPKQIIEKIKGIVVPESLGMNFNLTGKLVLVTYTKNFKGRRAGNEYYVDEAVRDYLKYRGVVKDIHTEKTKIMAL